MPWPKFDVEHALVSTLQMKEVENSIFSNGLPIEALMEKVGQETARWLLNHQQLNCKEVVVLVGPGHNGGDGLVVARELYLAGIRVSIWCPFELKKTLTIKHSSYAKWLGIHFRNTPPEVTDKALWIEAIFGIGQLRPLPDYLAELFNLREQKQPGKLITLDCPAGLCSDTGVTFYGGSAKATFTLTAGLIKQGLIQDQALENVGELVTIDIGIPEKAFQGLFELKNLRICPEDLYSFKWPKPLPKANKYQRGRLLVVSGSEQFPGASCLALKGALASGVGSIKAVLPAKVSNEVWKIAPEIVIAGVLDKKSKKNLPLKDCFDLDELDRIDAILIGPGLGIGKGPSFLDEERILNFHGLLVLDADALNLLALHPEGCNWVKQRSGPTWMTPHIAEFGRLFPGFEKQIPLEASRNASLLTGAGIVLKGAHSVIASPSGNVWQLGDTSPSVARAGFGDVLGGFLSGIGAIDFATNKKTDHDLLAAATLMHAVAGRNCTKGSTGTHIANDLSEMVRNIC